MQRAPALGVVVGEELGLVGRDVDLNRAVAGAPLAGKTQVERLLDGVVAPPVGDRIALEHLEQQAGAAAGRVALLAGGVEARAHRQAAKVAALRHAEAALDRGRERASVVGVGEVGLELRGPVVGAEAQALVELDVADQAVRVHLPVRIPDPLEVVERRHQLRAEHLREQLGAAVALAVLAGERAAVGDDEVCALLHERPERLHAGGGLQVEVHAGVHAPLAEVAVVDAPVAVVVEDLLEVAQVGAELVGVDGGVLPVALGVHVPGGAAVADRALADLPDADLVELVDDHPGIDLRPVPEQLERAPGLVLDLVSIVAAEFDVQPRAPFGEERALGREPSLGDHVLDQLVVEPLEPDRLGSLEDHRDVVGGLEHIGIAEQQRAALLRARDQADRRVEDVRAGALGADERARDVEAVLGEQLVEVVAGHAAGDVGVFGSYPVADAVSEVFELLVDLALAATGRDDSFQLLVGGRANCQPGAVVKHDIELDHVVARLARHQRVGAARVVPEHAPERAVLVGRRVRAVRQVVFLGGVAELVADDAGLNRGASRSPGRAATISL